MSKDQEMTSDKSRSKKILIKLRLFHARLFESSETINLIIFTRLERQY